MTAWQCLHGSSLSPRPYAGKRVLVHGAGGAVGGMAVQLAKAAGAAVVYATARAPDQDLVTSRGADCVIDFANSSFVDGVTCMENLLLKRRRLPPGQLHPGTLDLVIDTVGGVTQEESMVLMMAGRGELVSIAEPIRPAVASVLGERARFLRTAPSGAQLEVIIGMVDAGAVRPPRVMEYTLDQVRTGEGLVGAGVCAYIYGVCAWIGACGVCFV